MILKWKNAFFGENFIDKLDHVELLSVWAGDEGVFNDRSPDGPDSIPNYGRIHNCDTVVWGDGREPNTEEWENQLKHLQSDPAFRLVWIRTSASGGRFSGVHVHQIRVVGMWLLTDEGDTIERLVP